MSLPLRKCGLKQRDRIMLLSASNVTSLAEVWIETPEVQELFNFDSVTSLAEVWIETRETLKGVKHGLCHFPCGSVD